MAFQFSKSLNSTGTQLYITDITDDYGTTLPARNSLALIPYIVYHPTTGDVEATLVTYDPQNVVTFVVDVDGKDGWYTIEVYALNEYNGGGGLSEGDVVYDLADNLIKVYQGAALVEIEASDLADYDITYSFTDGALVAVETTLLMDKLQAIVLQHRIDLSIDACTEKALNKVDDAYQLVRGLREAARRDACVNLPLKAQQKIEMAVKKGTEYLEKFED